MWVVTSSGEEVGEIEIGARADVRVCRLRKKTEGAIGCGRKWFRAIT